MNYTKDELSVILGNFENDVEQYIKEMLKTLKTRHKLTAEGVEVSTSQLKVMNKKNEVKDIHLDPQAKIKLWEK